MIKTDKAFLAVTCLLALGLRLAHLFFTARDPYYTILYGDTEYFEKAARALAAGMLSGQVLEATLSPVYLCFNAFIYRIFGAHPFAVRIVQSVLGACLPVLFFYCGSRIWGARAGRAAAFLAAVCGVFIFYDAEILKPSLINSLFAALLCLFFADRLNPWVRWAAAGFLFGCIALLRMNFLAVLPLLLVWLWRYGAGGNAKQRAVLLSLFLVAFALTWTGWMKWLDHAAPKQQGGDVQLGIHFYIGNNESTEGVYKPVKGVKSTAAGHNRDARNIAERTAQRPLTDAEVNRYWIERGLDFIRARPFAWLALEAKKLFLALNDYEVPGPDHYDLARTRSPVLALPLPGFGLIASLGALGMYLTRRSSPQSGLLLGITLLYLCSLLVFFVRGDYRLPLYVPLILFAGAGVDKALDLLRLQDPVTAKKAAAVFILALVFTHTQTFVPRNHFFMVGERRLLSREAEVSGSSAEYPAQPFPPRAFP